MTILHRPLVLSCLLISFWLTLLLVGHPLSGAVHGLLVVGFALFLRVALRESRP